VVGLVGKVLGAVAAHMRSIASVYVHVIIVTTLVREALLAYAAHKGSVRVCCVVGQDVIPHLVLVALLATIVASHVDMNIVEVFIELPLCLVLHITLLALMDLF